MRPILRVFISSSIHDYTVNSSDCSYDTLLDREDAEFTREYARIQKASVIH